MSGQDPDVQPIAALWRAAERALGREHKLARTRAPGAVLILSAILALGLSLGLFALGFMLRL
jgi:hypothetical protein